MLSPFPPRSSWILTLPTQAARFDIVNRGTSNAIAENNKHLYRNRQHFHDNEDGHILRAEQVIGAFPLIFHLYDCASVI